MNRNPQRGFTLIELMIVVVIIGVLASIAIPNMIAMQDRAKEGSTRANMHHFQLTAEDYSVQNDSRYADTAGQIASLMPTGGNNFHNPFSGGTGSTVAWEDRPSFSGLPTGTAGIVSYSDSNSATYNIKGVGKATTGVGYPLPLTLSAGQ